MEIEPILCKDFDEAEEKIKSLPDLTEEDRKGIFCPLINGSCRTDCESLVRSRYSYTSYADGTYKIDYRYQACCDNATLHTGLSQVG